MATLNRELTTLKRSFRLGIEQERIVHAPFIKLLAEHNIRQGFVEPRTFGEIVRHLADPIDSIARFAYITGWRKQEVLTLQWRDVDLEDRRIRLRRENSKNEEPRVIVLTRDLLTLIQGRWADRQYPTKPGVALSTLGVSPAGAADRGLPRRMGRRVQGRESTWPPFSRPQTFCRAQHGEVRAGHAGGGHEDQWPQNG